MSDEQQATQQALPVKGNCNAGRTPVVDFNDSLRSLSQNSWVFGYSFAASYLRLAGWEKYILFICREVFAFLHEYMYKKSEIGNARFAVLSKTNMLEYACEVYKEINQTQDVPKGL